MATLSLDHIDKTYPNGYSALHGIDLAIDDGELIVVVGPSGCGKSTLLRCLAGLEDISSGELTINARRVNDLEPAERDIAMVFQNYALYPHMSVADNMGYALKNRGMAKAERHAKVAETAQLLGLESLLERRPRQLSGGQRQRVAMGRAIVREPQVFLFDEPLSNLDAKLRVQMRLEIRRLQKRLGVTAVYVTHDQVEAMTLADRLVVMNAGRIEQVGTPMALYERPQSVFVGGFIGSPAMNLLSVDADSTGLQLPGGGRLAIQAPLNKALTLGIRPEHIRLAAPATADLIVHVDMLEPLGADILAYCQLPNQTTSTKDQSRRLKDQATPLVVRFDGARKLHEGDTLALALPHEQLHLFDNDSGQRLDVEMPETA